jgi:hypothetical protein
MSVSGARSGSRRRHRARQMGIRKQKCSAREFIGSGDDAAGYCNQVVRARPNRMSRDVLLSFTT